ncbi:hypothetical protein PENSPDRAFT_693595 [Peniophora sp. CONT]|nr:hypothetical protein PENSPDRAFT_693595 [Peniophora sp. CONT]
MDSLPEELLVHIIESVPSGELGPFSTALIASHVCRKWRVAVLDIGRLWSTLPVPGGHRELTALSLERSKALPIHCVLYTKWYWEGGSSLLSLQEVARQASRIRTLLVDLNTFLPRDAVDLAPLKGALKYLVAHNDGTLEQLVVRDLGFCRIWHIGRLGTASQLSGLRTLCLHACSIPTVQELLPSSLTTLKLDRPMLRSWSQIHHITQALHNVPQLTSLHLDIRRNDIDTDDTTTCRSSDVALSHLRHIHLAGDIVLVLTLFGALTFPSVCEVFVRGTSSDHPIDPFIPIFQRDLASHFATSSDVRFSRMQLDGVGVFDRANRNAVVFTSPVSTESQALPPIFSLEWDELYKYGDTGNEDMDPSLLVACIKGHPVFQSHSATVDANVLHSYPYISDAFSAHTRELGFNGIRMGTHREVDISGSYAEPHLMQNWFAPLLALPKLTVITLEGMNFEAPAGPIDYDDTSSSRSHSSSPAGEWEDTETPRAILESFWDALVERLRDKEELELVVRRCEIARGRIQDALHAVGSNTWRVDWDGEERMALRRFGVN